MSLDRGGACVAGDQSECKGGDEGVPIAVGQPDSAQAKAFRGLAEGVVERLDSLSALKLPTIG